MALDMIRDLGPSTRVEMFLHGFGPNNLADCKNPSSFLHKAIKALVPGRVAECRYRDGSRIYQLAEKPIQLPNGLFTAEPTAPASLTNE